MADEAYVLVLKRQKLGNPPHLKPYQEKMGRVAPLCQKEAAHLTGTKRINRFNQCIRDTLRTGKP